MKVHFLDTHMFGLPSGGRGGRKRRGRGRKKERESGEGERKGEGEGRRKGKVGRGMDLCLESL